MCFLELAFWLFGLVLERHNIGVWCLVLIFVSEELERGYGEFFNENFDVVPGSDFLYCYVCFDSICWL